MVALRRWGVGRDMTSRHSSPLLIEWSPVRVRVFDPSTRLTAHGTSLADCLRGQSEGREAIFAISQRSAFIRALYVPDTSRSEIAKVLELQLERVLPLNPKEYAFGFRLGGNEHDRGRLAVVGAVKTESLRKLYNDAASCGLRVRCTIPLAFGSWLAARARSLDHCAVVDTREDVLNVDLVHDGELWYSRSVPLPDAFGEVEDEIARTFAIAEIQEGPILAAGPGIGAELTAEKDPVEYLADSHLVDKLLFSIKLPEEKEAKSAKARRWKIQRASAAAFVAVALGAYAYAVRLPAPAKTPTAESAALLKSAQLNRASAQAKVARWDKANRILDVAFEPGQTFSDMVTVLANSASAHSWFTGLVIGRGQPITIEGLALSDTDVATFVDAVSKDPRFKEMKVASTAKATIGKKPVTQFLISGRSLGCLPFDRPPKGGKRS